MLSVPARRVENFDACEKAGDFFLTPVCAEDRNSRRLSFLCPCGCGMLAGIRVRDDGEHRDGAWGWNRDEEKPTTTPSILIDPSSNHWHGYLTDGVFVPC